MRKLLVKPQARQDLLVILHFIAADNAEAAAKVGQTFERTFQELIELPNKGHARKMFEIPIIAFGECTHI